MLNWFRPWRQLRGGIWVRCMGTTHPSLKTIWLRNREPMVPEYLFKQWIREGHFQREVYPWKTLLGCRIGQALCDFCLDILHAGPKGPEDRKSERRLIRMWRNFERRKRWINDLKSV